MSRPVPRWIAFDAVGTLLAPAESIAVTYHRIGSAHGTVPDVETVRSRFRDAFRRRAVLATASPGGHRTNEAKEYEWWQEVVGEVFPELADPAPCFRALWDWYAAPAAWRVFDDVPASLARLRERGLQIGVASNFDGRLPNLLSAHFATPFDAIAVSSEIGWRKPAPEFYAALLSLCHARPAEVVMVGDDVTHDFDAPRAAGMQAWHLDRTTTDASPLAAITDAILRGLE